jgi:uncharacterized protein YkwD
MRRWWRVVMLQILLGTVILSGANPAQADDPNPPEALIGHVSTIGPAAISSLPASPSARASAASADEIAQQVVEAINAARWENGHLPPLKRQSGLDAAAAYHSQDMAVDNYFAHDSYNRVAGSLVFERYWWERVQSYYPGWNGLGECIAAGFADAASVVNGWLGSTGHRAIMLSTGYTEIGSGFYQGGTWGTYWTTDYGSRCDTYPVVINREAASTSSRAVSLYVYGAGWAQQMRFRNENGAWSNWEAYNPDRAWTLSCGTGTKTVSVEIAQGSQVRSYSDTILLSGEDYHLEATDQVVFFYERGSGQLFPATALPIQVENTGLGCSSLQWSVTRSGTWFTVSPASGSTPATLTVTPEGFPTAVGVYNGSVTVTATQPPGVTGSPQSVEVTLIVADHVYRLALPYVARGRS